MKTTFKWETFVLVRSDGDVPLWRVAPVQNPDIIAWEIDDGDAHRVIVDFRFFADFLGKEKLVAQVHGYGKTLQEGLESAKANVFALGAKLTERINILNQPAIR